MKRFFTFLFAYWFCSIVVQAQDVFALQPFASTSILLNATSPRVEPCSPSSSRVRSCASYASCTSVSIVPQYAANPIYTSSKKGHHRWQRIATPTASFSFHTTIAMANVSDPAASLPYVGGMANAPFRAPGKPVSGGTDEQEPTIKGSPLADGVATLLLLAAAYIFYLTLRNVHTMIKERK